MELDWLFYFDRTHNHPEKFVVEENRDRLIHGTSVKFVQGVISAEYQIVGIVCPRCERKSYSRGDAVSRFCSRCGYHTAPTSEFICQRAPRLR